MMLKYVCLVTIALGIRTTQASSPFSPPCEGRCCMEKPDYCQVKDASAYCGKSDQASARFTDGSGCSCKWDEVYREEGKCAPQKPPPAPGGNSTPPLCQGQCCQELQGFCEKKDPNAYCGKSEQAPARFTDGSGCSCKWNEEYGKDGKCVPQKVKVTLQADPTCAQIHARPSYLHPGVPQEAAEWKCKTDCAQPGYNCSVIAQNYPDLCTCENDAAGAPLEHVAIAAVDSSLAKTCHDLPNDYCHQYGDHAYCGNTTQKVAEIGDGCACNWDYVFMNGACCTKVSGSSKWNCDRTPVPPPPCVGKCCEETADFCLDKDKSAYCGKSEQESARFTDGSGCSCKWGEEYVNGKCVEKKTSTALEVEAAVAPVSKCASEKSYCTEHYGAHAFCGAAPAKISQIRDGSGCACDADYFLCTTTFCSPRGQCVPKKEQEELMYV